MIAAAVPTEIDRTNDLALLQEMAFIRTFEETVLQLRRDDVVNGSVHVCVGQESVPVAACRSLDARDRVIATYRGHGWALAKGVPAVAVMSEILGRATGTNGGRGGSPYLTAPEYGFVGENSIVGAGAPIANGIAMGLASHGQGGVTVVSFGDGATNQGAVHEALVFAAARALPVIFVCENNDWSEMTPIRDTVPNASLSARAGGYGVHSVELDGSKVDELVAGFAAIVGRVRAGAGPAFVEVRVPRLLGHYSGDIEHYRVAEDKEAHRARDPLASYASQIREQGTPAEAIDRAFAQATAAVDEVVREALDAPHPRASTAVEHVVGASERKAPKALPTFGEELSYGLAVNRALHLEMEERANLITFGEDIAIPGGTFGVTRNLRKRFGERAFDTPIAESAILGAAVGASQEGLLPVVEIMWTDFLFVAFDQVVNQMSNVRYLSRSAVTAPLVVRMQQGVTPGSCAQHSQSLEALLAHIPGIKVGLPSNPNDAFAMLRAAIADPDPVFVIESRALYQNTGFVDTDAPVEPAFGARLVREGEDLLIVTWGRMALRAIEAADRLAEEGVEASVLDLRWIAPLDEEAIAAALERSAGKLLIVHEANQTGGFGAEIAARVADRFFYSLDAPIARVAMPDVRVPAAPVLQDALVPDVDTIVNAARKLAHH